MFYSLPVETVCEAKQRTRRATVYFFILLVLLYAIFVDLMAGTTYAFGVLWVHSHDGIARAREAISLAPVLLCATLAAVLLATSHFLSARAKSLDDLLASLGAKPADPADSYHQQFINIVQEAEAATGIHGIRPVVLSTPGSNAFSLQDGQGRSAIGATDGLLSKLNRQELSAVVAHEAAHLVHEDSRLVTTACFLFGFFGSANTALGLAMGQNTSAYDRRSSSRAGGFWLAVLILWVISGVGYLITKLVFMAISREREYLADADGVAMCKDPLSLAESLYKISRRFRGAIPDQYGSLFILNPSDGGIEEEEGLVAELFSNHPPVSQRISKLLAWAKSDLPTLQQMDLSEEKATQGAAPAAGTEPDSDKAGFMAFQGNRWTGPFQPTQLLSMGFLNPSTWVCPEGSQQVMKASESSLLAPLFLQQVQGMVSPYACPRCKVPMIVVRYEGTDVDQCTFCKGYLLKAGVLERIIAREEVVFTPENIKKAKIWRDSQRGTLKDRDSFPEIKCPFCGSSMGKGIHSMLTQVVLDHCSNEKCGALWCDGGEMETIQMLVEDAHRVG